MRRVLSSGALFQQSALVSLSPTGRSLSPRQRYPDHERDHLRFHRRGASSRRRELSLTPIQHWIARAIPLAVRFNLNRPEETARRFIAAHYVAEIRNVQPSGPYYLGGFCLGGTVALEVAHQLLDEGELVDLLALIDAYAPGYLDVSPILSSRRFRLYHRVRMWGEQLFRLSSASPRRKVEFIRDKLRRVLRRSSSPELEAAQSSIRRAVGTYRPRVYPGRVALFMAREQPPGLLADPTFGWARLTSREVEIHRVPGYYQHIIYEPHARDLARQLSSCLEDAPC